MYCHTYYLQALLWDWMPWPRSCLLCLEDLYHLWPCVLPTVSIYLWCGEMRLQMVRNDPIAKLKGACTTLFSALSRCSTDDPNRSGYWGVFFFRSNPRNLQGSGFSNRNGSSGNGVHPHYHGPVGEERCFSKVPTNCCTRSDPALWICSDLCHASVLRNIRAAGFNSGRKPWTRSKGQVES